MDARTALQRLVWTNLRYGSGTTSYQGQALYDHRWIAFVQDVPAGWSMRLFCLDYWTPGAHELFDTYEDARAAIELWVSGLDIEPW